MSIEALNWAWKQPVPNSSAKFVLLALANRADADTQGRVVAFPSVAYVAAVTSQDRKTVISGLAKLCGWGLIEDTGRRVGRTGQVIIYALNCPPDLFTEQSQKRNSSKNGTVPKSHVKSTGFPSKQSQKRDTDSFKDSSLIQSGLGKAGEPKRESPLEAAIAHAHHVYSLTGNAQERDESIAEARRRHAAPCGKEAAAGPDA